MATYTSELLQRVRNNLLGSRQGNLNVLTTVMPGAASDAAGYGYLLTLGYTVEGIASGTVIGVGAHTFQAVSIDTTAKTITGVILDQLTPAQAVEPVGSIVRINPEYTDLACMRAINEALADMSSPVNGLFDAAELTFTYNPAIISYDLPTSSRVIQEVLEVSYDEPGPERQWRIVPRNSYNVKRLASTTDFPSGVALSLNRGGYPGRTVRVIYGTPFVPITAWTSATASPVPDTLSDVVVLGATAKLLGPQEARRNTLGAQSDTRRSTEVQAGANIGAARWFQGEYQRRVSAEAARNARLWPHRRRTH